MPADDRRRARAVAGPDFRSVFWRGKTFDFTKSQAAVVKLLWEQWERRTPIVGQEYILTEIGSDAERLRDVFRPGKKPHPAWGTFIKSAGDGAYQLSLEE